MEIAPPLYKLSYLNDSHKSAMPPRPEFQNVSKEDFNRLRNTADYRAAIGDRGKPFALTESDPALRKINIKKAPLVDLIRYNKSFAIAVYEDRLVLLRAKTDFFANQYSENTIKAARELLQLAGEIDLAGKIMELFTGKVQLPPPLLNEIYRLFSSQHLDAEYILRLDLPRGFKGPVLRTEEDEDRFARAATPYLDLPNGPLLPMRLEDIRPLTIEELFEGTGGIET